MADKKNILVLVPDGTGVKNYLYTGIFDSDSFRLGLLHSFDQQTLSDIAQDLTVDYQMQIPKYAESAREKFLRELIHRSRLKHNAKITGNKTILKFWNKRPSSLKLKLFYKAVIFAARFVNSYKAILKLETRYNKALGGNIFYQRCKDLINEKQPDYIFCTHQRALTAPTVFKAARDLGVKTVTVIYSWDNLPKARLALQADNYLVWSAHMKAELMQFYPEIKAESILVTGTPQFEFYSDPANIIDKEKFFQTYDLDPNKGIICFSGDDVRTSPNDPHYLDHLARTIANSPLKERVQILFRRCPVDVSGRYDEVIEKYPGLIKQAPPLWNFKSDVWSTIYPSREDIRLLVSTAKYCDMVINVGSTMAFDFGIFNKPCVFINYDVEKTSGWTVDIIYQYQHFRSMPAKDAVYWLNSEQDIEAVITKALENPNTSINKWFEVVVNHSQQASENIKKIFG